MGDLGEVVVLIVAALFVAGIVGLYLGGTINGTPRNMKMMSKTLA